VTIGPAARSAGSSATPTTTTPTESEALDDVSSVAGSTAIGRLYVAYRIRSGVGMIYCISVFDDAVLWNRAIDPDIDRLAIHPGGQLLYVATFESGSAEFAFGKIKNRA